MTGSEGWMSDLTWRKSSYSSSQENCVELTDGAVRDSKNPAGPLLSVNITALVATVRSLGFAAHHVEADDA
jgi:hypothetical protein